MIPLLVFPFALVLHALHEENPERTRRVAESFGVDLGDAEPSNGLWSDAMVATACESLQKRVGAASVAFVGDAFEVVNPRKSLPGTFWGKPVRKVVG